MNKMEQTSLSAPGRDSYIDNIKGLFMFFVVIGHLFDYLDDPSLPLAAGIRTLIYVFHMPGFIFLSGFLAKSFNKKQGKTEKLLSYGALYLLFKFSIDFVHYVFNRDYFKGYKHIPQLVILVIAALFALWMLSAVCKKYLLLQYFFIAFIAVLSLFKINILSVDSAPWYLLSLIFWYIFIYLTQHINPKYVIFFSIAMAVFLDYQQSIGKFLSLARTINFLPFFLLGYYMTKEQFSRIAHNLKWKLVSPVFLTFMLILFYFYGSTIKKYFGVFIYGVDSYTKLTGILYYFAPFVSILFMVTASLLMFSVFVLCPRKTTFWTNFGKHSIAIYVFHRLFKNILYYAGLFSVISSNQIIAVIEVSLISLFLCFVFGNKFFAQIILNITNIKIPGLYKKNF